MADPTVLQERFSRGMRRDTAREDMRADSAWNLVDYIPDLEAHLRKRGGWTYASNDITAVDASAAYVNAGLYAPFSAAAKNLAVDEDGDLHVVASDGTVTRIGATGGAGAEQNPVFHRDQAIILASHATVYSYDGTTLAALGGSPPAASYATVHKDRTVLAGTTANPERLFFSDPGDPALWDTTNTYWDGTYPVTGLASIRNAILIFSNGHTERLLGSIPPPGSDFVFGPLFDEGTPSATSVAYWGDNVVFGNPSGVFITDGSALDDLTKAAGMLDYWQNLFAAYTDQWRIAGGVYRSYYVLSVTNGNTLIDAAMIDLQRRTWLRLSNLKARSFWSSSAPDEMYFGLRAAARVGKFSPVFSPAAATKNDADGTAVTPVYESPFFVLKGKQLSWKRLYVDADVRDAASDNPTLAVSYIESPELTSYTALGSTFGETTAQTPRRFQLGQSNYGMAFKVAQTNASSDTRLVRLRAEVHPREGSRIG